VYQQFQESLAYDVQTQVEDGEQYFGGLYLFSAFYQAHDRPGLSLRQIIREYKWQTLVLFKCCLLQQKVG